MNDEREIRERINYFNKQIQLLERRRESDDRIREFTKIKGRIKAGYIEIQRIEKEEKETNDRIRAVKRRINQLKQENFKLEGYLKTDFTKRIKAIEEKINKGLKINTQIDKGSKVIDVNKFLKYHLETIKRNYKNIKFEPYLIRLENCFTI